MRILLVNPQSNFDLDNEVFPRLSLLLLGTILEGRGHHVRVIHMVADRISLDGVVGIARGFRYDIVGLTATTYQTKYTKLLSRALKENLPHIKIVLGGPHVSSIGEVEAKEAFPYIDTFVLGEGEQAIVDIVEGTTSKPKQVELDSLPFPNPAFVKLKAFSGSNPIIRNSPMQIMASRGCPFNCSFCCKPTYGRTVKFHSPKYILENTKFLKDYYKINEICFQDDAFNLNLEWATSILEGIIRKGLNKDLIFRVGFRSGKTLVSKDLLKLVKRAGVWVVFYGVESGSQYMLDRMNKGVTLDEIREAFALTHKEGIKTIAPFILGLPGETDQTIKESIKLYKELKPYSAWFSKAMPFPGTPFRKEVEEKGLLVPGDYDIYSPHITRVRTEALDIPTLDKWYKDCNSLTLRDMVLHSLQDPELLIGTLKGMGVPQIAQKILRTFRRTNAI